MTLRRMLAEPSNIADAPIKIESFSQKKMTDFVTVPGEMLRRGAGGGGTVKTAETLFRISDSDSIVRKN
jgi:hypothetical protein